MAKHTKASARAKIPERDVVVKFFRLPTGDVYKLAVAAAKAGLTQTTYVLLALRSQFEKDNDNRRSSI